MMASFTAVDHGDDPGFYLRLLDQRDELPGAGLRAADDGGRFFAVLTMVFVVGTPPRLGGSKFERYGEG